MYVQLIWEWFGLLGVTASEQIDWYQIRISCDCVAKVRKIRFVSFRFVSSLTRQVWFRGRNLRKCFLDKVVAAAETIDSTALVSAIKRSQWRHCGSSVEGYIYIATAVQLIYWSLRRSLFELSLEVLDIWAADFLRLSASLSWLNSTIFFTRRVSSCLTHDFNW